MNRKITSVVLAISMLASSIAAGTVTANAVTKNDSNYVATVKDNSSVGANYGLTDNIQDGTILHCFNWKYSDIEAELPNIAAAGFTSVQTSPVQPADSQGAWYWLYLPRAFDIGTNNTGGPAELESLCKAAENYGIKVIVDVVANHLTGDHNLIQNDLKDSKYWHTFGSVSGAQWNDRYAVTHGDIGMADLATEDSYVQQVVKNYILKLKGIGVDGIRWDAAKHIDTPAEYGSQFWPTVTATGLYNYGEILGGLDDAGNSDRFITEYTKYMSYTDNYYGYLLREGFNSGKAPTAYANWAARTDVKVTTDKLVYWAESHDTWSNDTAWGYSWHMSQNNIDRAYAVAASRYGATALYFSRPSSHEPERIIIGNKGSTHFTSPEVAAVNHFHNAMVGQKEYYTTSNNCSVVCREKGAVIVAGSGSNFDVSVTNGGATVAPGTYTDEITGNTWTVTSSSISGKIGSSGIAVIYDAKTTPSASASVGTVGATTKYTTDTLSVKLSLKNATSGTYSIDNGTAKTFTDGTTITIGSASDAFGKSHTLKLTATDASTVSDPVTYTYVKADPSEVQKLYFDNTSYKWSSVNAYIYTGSGETAKNNAAWPGKAMTYNASTGLYEVEVSEALSNGKVIFTENATATTNRYPADMQEGLSIGGKSMKFSSGNSWTEYTEVPTTPSSSSTTPVPSSSVPAGNVLIGDVNQDGGVSISDATEIQRHIVSMVTLTGDALIAADVDQSNKVDVKDVTCIQYFLVGDSSKAGKCNTYTGGGINPTQPTQQTQPTQPTQPTVAGNFVYYQNSNNWSTPYAYYWSDSNKTMTTWPGKAMTSVGNGVYSIELPADAKYIIFSNNGGSQTADLTIPAFGQIYKNNSWSAYSGETPTTPSGDGKTIYYTGNLSTPYAYYWSDSNKTMTTWPGKAMTSVGSGVYSITIPSDATYIIFSNNGGSQTADLTISGNYYNNGNWTNYNG
ncbi:MAG: starch-binding protein [Ruminococcus sp.]|nr:starch-binding protein [Ruminococcus sp.]